MPFLLADTEENVAGDAFVRELDMSRITLRLKEKQDKKSDNGNEEHTIAKLQGNTIDILQRCLVSQQHPVSLMQC